MLRLLSEMSLIKDTQKYFTNLYNAVIRNPTTLKALHWTGLTNLSDQDIKDYTKLYRKEGKSVAYAALSPKVVRFFHRVGLTNLTNDEVDQYCKKDISDLF